MGFTNIVFVFAFLPTVLLLYLGASMTNKVAWKNAVLLVASIFFYAWCGVQYLLLICVMLVVTYMGISLMKGRKKKVVLISTILINVLILIVFKYYNFFVNYIVELFGAITGKNIDFVSPNIPLPLGISFIVFQIISFVIDFYKGKIKKVSFANFALYIMLFPQLIEGPIVRYEEIERQLYSRNLKLEDLYEGMQRFIIGMLKKVLIADVLVGLSDKIFETAKLGIPLGYAWLGAITYAFVIYFDFSGYTDMAIGLCRVFGFHIGENFDYPYMATSIQDFWRRWHISLTSWFRDYIYIPLGGNRKGKKKTYRNLIIIYLLTGIWHGANWTFIIWGVFHGIFQLMERMGLKKFLEKIPTVFSRIYSWLVILIGWVLFRADTLTDALQYIKSMFVSSGVSYKQLDILLLINRQVIITIAIAILASTPLLKTVFIKIENTKWKIAINVILLVLFVVALTAIVSSAFSPSIYTKF